MNGTKRTYTAVVGEGADGVFDAFFPDVPGVAATGDTRDEAAANARLALGRHLEGREAPDATRYTAVEVTVSLG